MELNVNVTVGFTPEAANILKNLFTGFAPDQKPEEIQIVSGLQEALQGTGVPTVTEEPKTRKRRTKEEIAAYEAKAQGVDKPDTLETFLNNGSEVKETPVVQMNAPAPVVETPPAVTTPTAKDIVVNAKAEPAAVAPSGADIKAIAIPFAQKSKSHFALLKQLLGQYSADNIDAVTDKTAFMAEVKNLIATTPDVIK